MSEDTLAKAIYNGDYTSGTLSTLLTNLDDKWDFVRLIHTPFYARMVLEKLASLNVILGSTTAKNLILESSRALQIVANSEIVTKNIFSDLTLATLVVSNQNFLNAYASDYEATKRLKRQVNASGSKLKQAFFTSAGSSNLAVTNLKAYSCLAVGGGSFNYVNSTVNYAGNGAELVVHNEIIDITGTLTMTVGQAGSVSSNSGTASTVNNGASNLVTATFGSATIGGAGGTTTNGGISNLPTKDPFIPWHSVSWSEKGELGLIESASNPRAGGRGGKIFTEYGKGTDLNNPAGTSKDGLIVFNYIAD